MSERDELQALRRLAELEARSAAATPSAPLEKESTASPTNLLGAAIEPNLNLLSGSISGPLSGYAGMLGTILPGPEGQGARWTQKVQNALTYKPITSGGRIATEAIGWPFEKLAQWADSAGDFAAEKTGSPAVGAAVNAATQVGTPMLTKMLPITRGGSTPIGDPQGWLARRLMQSSIKPDRADVRTGAAARAISTMLDEGISPTPGGMAKVQRLVEQLDNKVNAGIAGSSATVNVPSVGGRLRDVHNNAVNQVNPAADIKAVREAWNEFRNSPSIHGQVDIPVQLAHELKRGTYRSLGAKNYGEIAGTSIEAQKALARGLREEVLAKVPEVAADLAREASLRNVLGVVETKAGMQANNNPMGLAGLRVDSPASWGAFMFDRSAQAKAALARALYAMGDPNLVKNALGVAAIQAGMPQYESMSKDEQR